MSPPQFLKFFSTKSGKLALFTVIFAGGLLLFSVFHDRTGANDELSAPGDLRRSTNHAGQPQIVHSVERPNLPFHPPAAKPDPPSAKQEPAGNQAVKTTSQQAQAPAEKIETPYKPLPSLSLLADISVGAPEPKALSPVFAPYGRLISCETVITVDSSSIQTPIIGLVIEDVYHAGKLVIPAGTEVHGTAQTDHHRERIASGTSWTLVWQTGEELHLRAVALDREFSGDQEGWGVTDGSAGLRGQLIKTDDMAQIKLFAATFLSGAADALTSKQQTVFGPIASPTLNNAPFEGAQKVLAVYAQQIYDAIQRDGFYVRVPSGKQFYLYVLQTIDRADAAIGGSASSTADTDEAPTTQAGISSTVPTISPSPSTSIFQP